MNDVSRDDIDGVLRAIVVRVEAALPRDDIENVWEFIDVGEPGLALETLCTQLDEYDIAVPPEVLDQMRTIGHGMGLDASLWEGLKLS